MTLLIFSYQNCSVVQKGTSEGRSENPTGTTALASIGTCEPALYDTFKNDLYPLVSVKCASCHRTGGPGKTKFAEADFNTAWGNFRGIGTGGPQKVYNNGTNPSHSGNPDLTGPQNEPILRPALDKYNNAILGCLSGSSGTLTKPLALSNLLTIANNTISPATEKILAWNLNTDLNSSNGIDYGEAYFIISAAKSTDGKSYVIYNPRIRTYEKEVDIGNIQVYINGAKIDTTSTFMQIDRAVPPYESENGINGLLSTFVSYIPYTIQTSDYIQISFGKLEAK